ncbi:MAG TPA: VTT domain-containing protein [Aquabacterium sp.]|nr:VTT domain-containing protein [Aquabacterium sp.]HRH28898.1 VTT domain-containing protein [Aquabacterium sp.]
MNRSAVLKALRMLALCFYVVLFGSVTWALSDAELRQHFSPAALAAWGTSLLAKPLGPLLVLLGYVAAVVLAIPVAMLITVGALVFGAWPGMAYTLVGMVAGSVVMYGIGRFIGANAVDAWATTGRVHALASALKRRGLWAIVVIRAVPIAPFVVVNLAAGAFRVSLRDYVLGSFIGLAPGTLMISLFTDQVASGMAMPTLSTTGWVGVGLGLLALGLTVFGIRRLRASRAP